MKFELNEKDLKIVDGKFVQLPMARFAALAEYVEDLEGRLLAAEINLRESARVGKEMEEMSAAEALEPLPETDAQGVQSVLDRLDAGEFEKTREEENISLRKLAMLSGIPYATLYRYLKRRQPCPTSRSKRIFYALDKVKLAKLQQQLSDMDVRVDFKQMQKQFRKTYTRREMKERG